MTRFATASILTSALALATFSGPVAADVTPQQAWDDLKAYMQGFGYDVTATEAMDGDTLTLSDISFVVPIPEENAAVNVTLPQLSYTDNGDGTVSMMLPESSDMVMTFEEDGAPVDGQIVVQMTQSGFEMTIAGEANDLSYTYAAERMGVALTDFNVEGEEITRDMFRAEIGMGPVAGSSQVTRADGLQRIAQDLAYGDITYDIAFNDPESDDLGSFKGVIRGLTGNGITVLPEGLDFAANPEDMFTMGMEVDASISHQGGETAFAFTDGRDSGSGQLSSAGGSLEVAVSEGGMSYALSALQQAVQVTVPDMPFPISAEFAELGMALSVPLAASETPQPANLGLLLADFTMSDMIWNLFDPGQMLSREPATIGANLDVEVTPFINLLDPVQVEAMEMSGGMPGELNTAKLTDLVVRAAGVELLGKGDFTFDNTDLESFDGLPRPEGKLDLALSGHNGLIDRLIQMGLLQESDAMGARMMLGMFTVPGDGPDSATSTLEINAQGHILANGQRIQ